ncbi:MAG: hypothetical protein P4N60_17640 [Verrucomicrobiae bacterium]|nr:hypothetical protein [Verrucomicrobiae bacterium]
MVVPNPGEEGYFQRLKAIAKAKTFTITKITPYFGEGVIGETPPSDVPPQMITPFAELEAVADFGNCKMPVRLISPIVSSEVSRLIGSGP